MTRTRTIATTIIITVAVFLILYAGSEIGAHRIDNYIAGR